MNDYIKKLYEQCHGDLFVIEELLRYDYRNGNHSAADLVESITLLSDTPFTDAVQFIKEQYERLK